MYKFYKYSIRRENLSTGRVIVKLGDNSSEQPNNNAEKRSEAITILQQDTRGKTAVTYIGIPRKPKLQKSKVCQFERKFTSN